MVRVFALFLSPIVYLHRSGPHPEQELRTVPLNYRANSQKQLPRSFVSYGCVSQLEG